MYSYYYTSFDTGTVDAGYSQMMMDAIFEQDALDGRKPHPSDSYMLIPGTYSEE